MLIEHEIFITVGRFGRTWGYQDDWDLVSRGDIEAWEGASKLFSNCVFDFEELMVTINADLTPIVAEIKRARNYARMAKQGAKLDDADFETDRWDGVLGFKVLFDVKSEPREKHFNSVYAKHFIEKYLYDLFFVVNFSSPGGCDFLNLKIISELDGYEYGVELSSYNFEEGYGRFLSGKSLAPRCLPFEKVFIWYEKLNLGVRQLPESNLERGIFALLHACKSNADVSSIVWVFHALEAIYKTKVGSGFNDLIERMSFVLQLNGKEKKYLKGELRRMYDLRSAFVHGGYSIHHPMENEILDARVNDQRMSEIELFQAGFDLVALSLQRFILNDWVGFEVKEEFVGLLS